MYYELALISVLIAGGYWGQYFVRQQAFRTYGLMQLGSAALAGIGLIGAKVEANHTGIVGAIGVGAGTCLLVLGPLARGLARRVAATERFGLADKLLDVANVLAPGSGVPDEQALLGAMREIRDGNIEHTVDALTAAKDRAPADARLAIDERIAMLYLTAYRWDEAIAHAEQHLFGALPETSEAAVSLRRALGVAPPVWVELLGAYGYKGDLDRAARMLARLEEVCAGREDAAIWIHRGRMVFLALAGRVSAVQTLVEPRRSRHMSRAARTYWLAVAHERRGDGAAAGAAYAKARSGSRGRPRVLIDQALARLANIDAIVLGPAAAELARRVEAAPLPAVVESRKPKGLWATWLLTGGILAVAAAIALLLGDSSDVGVLMRSGALVRNFVHAGEWWRLVSCVMVHVGGIHLLVNATGLWFLGRLAEDLFGVARTIAIFAIAGVAGSAASYLASASAVSAGASGAIFGLLGAVFVELTWHRARHRAAWNRGVWGSVAVVTVAQLGIGFLYPVIDQWAHGAGLAAGAVIAVALSPNAKWAQISRYVARAIAIGAGVVTVFAAVMVIRTSVADSFERLPRERHVIGDLTAIAPSAWQASSDVLEDPDVYIRLELQRQAAAAPLAVELATYAAGEPERAKKTHGFDQVELATDRIVPVPPGWDSSELVVSVADPLGNRQRYRVVVAGRTVADGVVLASLYLPETVARAAPGFFTALFASIAPQ